MPTEVQRSVPCPHKHCKASVGAPCVTRTGHPYAKWIHHDRELIVGMDLPKYPHYIMMVMMYNPEAKDSPAFVADMMGCEMIMRKWGDVQQG